MAEKFDLKTQAFAGMVAALMKTAGIEPSLAGIIKATGNDPEAVFAAVTMMQEKAPLIVQMIFEADARNRRIEDKLDSLLAARLLDVDPIGEYENRERFRETEYAFSITTDIPTAGQSGMTPLGNSVRFHELTPDVQKRVANAPFAPNGGALQVSSSFEKAGTGFDAGARGHELVGREPRPKNYCHNADGCPDSSICRPKGMCQRLHVGSCDLPTA
jgi:hypothetical protein